MREKEETTGLAHAFARLLDSLPIVLFKRIHTLGKVAVRDIVKTSEVSEHVRCELYALNTLVNSLHRRPSPKILIPCIDLKF